MKERKYHAIINCSKYVKINSTSAEKAQNDLLSLTGVRDAVVYQYKPNFNNKWIKRRLDCPPVEISEKELREVAWVLEQALDCQRDAERKQNKTAAAEMHEIVEKMNDIIGLPHYNHMCAVAMGI